MFAYLKGSLEIKTRGYIVIDVGGVGYKVFMSETAIDTLGEIGDVVKVHTYLKVREDDMSLYGFRTNEELRMFELLLSVSGIGAKSAITILSNITPSSFALAVISDDVNQIKTLPGIGPKTAQRLILELKDKLKVEQTISEISSRMEGNTSKKMQENDNCKETISALQVLGYSRKEIEQALEKVEKELSVEDMIRSALRNLAR